jgi:ribosome-binding protein aMBF1 (putative translation factor)
MYLDQFLFKYNISAKELAKKMNSSQTYISGVITGRVTPSIKFANELEKVTHGKVSWVEVIEGGKMTHEQRNLTPQEIEEMKSWVE